MSWGLRGSYFESCNDRDGEELVADELSVADGPLAFDYSGVCGYASTFDYSG